MKSASHQVTAINSNWREGRQRSSLKCTTICPHFIKLKFITEFEGKCKVFAKIAKYAERERGSAVVL
jgi:hypothetical protein